MTGRATDTTWGFRLVVLLPASRRISGETCQTWSLPEPVGDVQLSAAKETLQDAQELLFRGCGYATERAAHSAGTLFRDWLRVASRLLVLGFDVDSDLPPSWLGDEVRAATEAILRQSGRFLTTDVHRLLVYEETGGPARVSARAAGIVVQQSSTVLENVLTIARCSPLTDEQSLACDLVSLAEHEASDRARFLLPADCHGGPCRAFGTECEAPRRSRALDRGDKALSKGSGTRRRGSICVASQRAGRPPVRVESRGLFATSPFDRAPAI